MPPRAAMTRRRRGGRGRGEFCRGETQDRDADDDLESRGERFAEAVELHQPGGQKTAQREPADGGDFAGCGRAEQPGEHPNHMHADPRRGGGDDHVA